MSEIEIKHPHKTLSQRLSGLLHEWQEFLWAGALLALMILLFYAIPAMDPRAGIDGFGGLYALVVQLLAGVAITFMAWLSKRTYTFDLDDRAEAALFALAKRGDWHAFWLRATDRIELGAWLAFWAWVVL